MSEASDPASLIVSDTFLILFLSFLTYLLVILGGIYVVWLFPVVRNGSTSPSADVHIRWATTAASFLHSALIASVGTLVLFFEDWQQKSIVDGKSPLVPIFVTWELGHLLQQTMFKCYLLMDVTSHRSHGLLSLLRHLVMISFLPWYEPLGIGHFFLGLYFVSHFSSAFWNLRSLLAKGGKEQSGIYQFVSIMCPCSFVLCRFVPLLSIPLSEPAGFMGLLDQFSVLHLALVVAVTIYNSIGFIQIIQTKSILKRFKLA